MAKHPNWNKIEKLRDYYAGLKLTAHRKFDMTDYIQLLNESMHMDRAVTIGKLRKNGPSCGTANCMAGDAVIQFGNAKHELPINNYGSIKSYTVMTAAEDILNLTPDEGSYMFGGYWTAKDMFGIKRPDAIRYLSKVLDKRNIFVYTSRGLNTETLSPKFYQYFDNGTGWRLQEKTNG